MQIHVAKSDLADLPVDAVVNPGNSLGTMATGVGAALLERGGPRIEEEARASAPVAVGAALVTGAGSLPARHVIHAPIVESPGLKVGVENVRRATRAALLAAARHNLETIALPAVGGIGVILGLDEAARAIVDELRAHRYPHPTTVYLVGSTDEHVTAFAEALRNATTLV